ncbi:SEL1-like repeat protein [Leptotrichia shahii]|uniref:tetratricopeptide repeat protein n=1 Tax=Leptotrichia shahii TaxID=157691 RepID=UPI0028D354C7|nr:SEL1-like repeat protein [Leptotrichia shahii]
MSELIPIEDMNYLAQQSQGKINMILSGMTALMNDTEDKTEKIEKQNWFQRMVKTVTGKNRATREEIKQNHDKLNAYMSQAIAELYNRNCIDSQVMISLGTQLNELYAEHLQLKQMLGAFVVKLNEKIDSVDNFHMLNTEIEQGVYSDNEKIIAICKVMSQFDNRIMEEPRKLDILRRSMEKQEIITEDEVLLTDYLMDIMNISVDEIGKIYLELSTIRSDFFANLILGVIEDYHFLPDMQRKMMKKEKIIGNLIQREGLDDTITLSINEVYDNFINSKIEVKEGLIPVESIQNQRGNQISYNNNNNLEMKKAEQLFLNYKLDEAFELFKKLAENGNGRAMYFLSEFYGNSIGKIKLNAEKGKEWRIKGKEAGDVLAALNVAYSLPKNSDERNRICFELFENILKLSEDGDIFAQNELGDMYLYGYGIKEDEEEGMKWLKKSAKAGNWGTMHKLGNKYYNQGNYGEAVEWYRKSFDKGFDWDGYNLANCYYNGYGVPKNYLKALKLYREVYDLENSASGSAANAIGNIHYNEKNYSEAIKWYKKGIEKTLDWAYYNLANCYYYGNGVRKDELKALDLYKKAYDLGDSASGSAINMLGVIAYNRRDYKPAVTFYKRGTEKDYNWAYYNLAECYYNGYGVKKDKNKAYELYRKAAELGIEKARSIINNWY